MSSPSESVGPVDSDTALFFFENSLDMLALFSAEGVFVACNEAWRAATGWASTDLIGTAVIGFVHEEDRARVRHDGLGALAGDDRDTEFRFRTADGRWVWLRSRARVTASGRLTAVMRDVTRERARDAELQQAARSREMLRQAAGVGVWWFHPERGYEWSRELAALSPHLTELSSLEQFYAELHPDDRDKLADVIRRGVVDGEDATYEIRFRSPDGGWRHFRNHHVARPLPCGRHELQGIAQEVTELAGVRDAAREGEARSRGLIEEAPFAVALFSPALRYEVVSPRWAELFQVSADEIGGAVPDHGQGSPEFLAAVVAALGGETSRHTVADWTSPAGKTHVLRWLVRPHRDSAGAVVGAVAYVDDVTELQAARREAERNAKRLSLSLSAAQAGVLEIDYERKSIWTSPELDSVLGRRLTFADVSGELWPVIAEDDGETIEALRAWWRSDCRTALDVPVLLPDGGRRWCRVFFEARRRSDGSAARVTGLVLDIDVAKKQELALIEAERGAQAAAEAKSQFLANMSHEIRTPMNGVLGVLHLLRDEPLSPEARAMLDEASSCGLMLTQLINDVIDLSQIEAGRLEIRAEAVDVAALVRGTVGLLKHQAAAKSLALVVEQPETLWAEVDPVRLRQALFNLIGNAVKFTPQGEVRVRVARPAPDRLRVEVQDTGPGIGDEDQARLFSRFEQLDGSSTRRHGGSGLGLAITRRLAELMDGEVLLTSKPGAGATFTLDIAAALAQPTLAVAEPDSAPASGLRVLLAEDNPTNRLVIGKMLEALGCVVESAVNGREAMEAAARGAFDLIFMDIQMPVMDGLEAVRAIRGSGGPQAATPVIALTANALAHQAAAYRAAGMNGVVAKPVSPAALLAEMVRLADVQAAAQAA